MVNPQQARVAVMLVEQLNLHPAGTCENLNVLNYCNKLMTRLLFLFLFFLCLHPQLFYEHIHQSANQRELQHISCVCTDLLYRQHECNLSALPGPDLHTDWRGQLCASEYIRTKNHAVE